MEYIAEIHSLSAKFFTDYPHSQYPEIAVKKNRPYSCLLIEYMDDLFICIPFVPISATPMLIISKAPPDLSAASPALTTQSPF